MLKKDPNNPKPVDHVQRTRKKTGSHNFVFRLINRYRRPLFWTGVLAVIIILLIPIITFVYFLPDLKNKENVMNREKTGLTLLDRDGNEFYSFYQPKNITYVPLSEIPQSMQQAVIASEDKNFYTNNGISFRGMARAFFTNITAGKVVEGGSTITQELVKNAFLSSSRNVLRKYQELVLAYEMNKRYSKEDIIEMYLNSVYFGEGAFGLENAAQAYFGEHASDLTLSQSALLVGLLPAPSAYSPLSNNPQIAINKRNIVLNEMVQDNVISQDQADTAIAETPSYNPTSIADNKTFAHHFANYVRDQLIKKFGEEKVTRGGFQVKTTLNSDWQQYAERAVKNRVLALSGNNTSNGAAVAIDPHTGQIEAMVGSYDWTDASFGQTNMAVTPRQPGSSFKPIIYADAIEQRQITAATELQDVKTTFPGNYTPHDYDLRYRGPVTVRRALSNSLNIPAVEVMEKVGIPSGLDYAKKLGITTLGSSNHYGLSLVLGAGEVPLLQMTGAYSVFAAKGVYHEPTAIIEIRDKYGNKIDSSGPSLFNFFNPLTWFASGSKTVIDEGTAYIISSILSDNNARAEEFGSALSISRPAAVKTGTTEDFRDALTIGYTPDLVVGVWVGNNDNTPMDSVAGSLGAAPIWRNMMENFLAGTPISQFEQPSGVVKMSICGAGSVQKTEYFLAGTQPDETCESGTGFPTNSPTPTGSTTPTPTPTNQPEQPTGTPEPTETPQPTIGVPTAAPTNAPQPTSANNVIPTI